MRMGRQGNLLVWTSRVARFIPFSWKKKHYFSGDSEVAKSILQIVKTWNKSKMPDTESLINYTNEWVDRKIVVVYSS